MKNFIQSLKYLKPYRVRLGISIGCVILIAGLWGGGLGMILPGAKILLSQEGLHGWAWNSIVQDRLSVSIIQRIVPAQVRIEGKPIPLVLEVTHVKKGGPACKAGIKEGIWIVGTGTRPDTPDSVLRGDVLSRKIAKESQVPLVLRIYDSRKKNGRAETVRIVPEEVHFSSRLLGMVATKLPEPKNFADRFGLLVLLLITAAVITLLRDLLRFSQEYLVMSSVYRGVMDLRADNYSVVLRLPTTFFSEKGISDTMSRLIRDTGELARGQITLFGKTLVEPAKAVAALAVALLISWKLTILAMVAGPPAFLLIRKLGKRMRRASKRALERWSGMLGILEETLTGIRVVKAYTMEVAERKRFFRVNRALLKQQKRMAAIDAATAPAVEALGITAALGATCVAGYWVFHYQMKPDDFLTLMACLFAMFDPIRKLAKVATRFQQAEAAAARVFELQSLPTEKILRNAPALPRHTESIEFKDVSFRYPNAQRDAISGINLFIHAGETIVIVGPNGSGKTTLAALIPRLIDPTRGVVLIDDADISKYSIRSLRQQIGMVTQQPVLFHATIAENIAYGKRGAKQEEILAAARKAFVDEFVSELPQGFDTMVGEHGATLSGGQCQRIAIARAILRDPAILIFDEATSQVDPDSERKINQAMAEFRKGRTSLIISHRLSTVQQADRIIVMQDGKIIDIGKHADLNDRCPLYKQLCQQHPPNLR